MSLIDTPHFAAWTTYWGELKRFEDPAGETAIYGFENVSDENKGKQYAGPCEIPDIGATYGFVMKGAVTVLSSTDLDHEYTVDEGQWFHFPGGCWLWLSEDPTQVVVTQKVGFRGQTMVGGPIEELGRLKYIDGCSDTLLVCPPLLGDPCFNHLHFPPGIDQTEHDHPSNRSGGIARGAGVCVTPYGEVPLVPGVIFHIPYNGLHKFRTDGEELDVIAYHPDSDWGPTDIEHPMVNRTMVDGHKVDNSTGVHSQAEVIR